jgi:hypothetical protein
VILGERHSFSDAQFDFVGHDATPIAARPAPREGWNAQSVNSRTSIPGQGRVPKGNFDAGICRVAPVTGRYRDGSTEACAASHRACLSHDRINTIAATRKRTVEPASRSRH